MAQCPLCEAFTLAPDDYEWVCEPFCWKCGTYLEREGNRWGWDGQKAKARANGFDASIMRLIGDCRGGGDG